MTEPTTPSRLTLLVSEEAESERLDRFLASEFEDRFSRERIKTLIQEGRVYVNGRPVMKPAHRLKEGDTLALSVPEARPVALALESIPLEVLFEDDALLVVNKPAGMLTHPAGRETTGTLVNALLAHCGESLSGINGELRPGIVHRLDRDTSGLLMVAKTDQAHRFLSAQLQERSAKREYRAIVQGDPPQESGTVNAPIGRHPKQREKMAVVPAGREAVTHWEVIERIHGRFCYVHLRLETGRTHQIRVHMAHIGFPIVGDPQYGRGIEKTLKLKTRGQLLQAYRLRFVHPVTKAPMNFEIPVAPEIEAALRRLRDL